MLEHTLLPADSLSPLVRKCTAPDAPERLKQAAARGALPIPPPDMVTALFQLSLNPALRDTALESLRNIPDDVVQALVKNTDLPAAVLDLLARERVTDDAHLEPLILNRTLDDLTLTLIAKNCSEPMTELIAGIHVRLLRTPAIIASLHDNANTRQSTLDKLLDLAQREDVTIPGLKRLQEAHALPRDPNDPPGLPEDEFQDLLRDASVRGDKEFEEDSTRLIVRDRSAENQPDEEPKGNLWRRLQMMTTAQKVRMAALGSREERNLLVRDTKRIIYMAAIESPKVSGNEVFMHASNRSLSEDVISYIANRRDWVRAYPVKVALVNNPKCPLRDSIKFLKELNMNDLRRLQRNKNIPAQLARQARTLYRDKSSGGGGRKKK